MKKIFYILAFPLVLGTLFSSCEEEKGPSTNELFQKINKAYTDSIAQLPEVKEVNSIEILNQIPLNQMFKIKDDKISSNKHTHYIYCKKLALGTSEDKAVHPTSNSTLGIYYYGTLVNGQAFDGNFRGYGAKSKISLPIQHVKPTKELVYLNMKSLILGWQIALPYMSKGDRWMLYIPSDSAYGNKNNGNIPANSFLVFDISLKEVNN